MGRSRDPKPRRVTVIRYQLPDGSRCRSTDPGAKKVKTKSESYYLHLPPQRGVAGAKRERIPLETTDEAVAWEKVRRIMRGRKEEELGILSDKVRQAGRPIAEHVDDWLAAVGHGGAGAKQLQQLRSRVESLIALAGWKRIGEIRKSGLAGALAALREAAGKGRGSAGAGKGLSAQTRNHYLSAARQFTRWLRDEGRLEADPLAGMKGVSVEADRRHDRRVPDELEVRLLFEFLAQDLTVRTDMTGPHRALGYAVAMCAGLRAGELRRLTAASFDLAAGAVRVKGSSDKARRRRTLALPRWLCAKVQTWLGGGGLLFDSFPQDNPGRILQADLAAARGWWIALAGPDQEECLARSLSTTLCYEIAGDDGPTYLDFHALRHWYITQLAATDGISPSTLQALSRHADPKLTLAVYAHAKGDGTRAAVEQLPKLG